MAYYQQCYYQITPIMNLHCGYFFSCLIFRWYTRLNLGLILCSSLKYICSCYISASTRLCSQFSFLSRYLIKKWEITFYQPLISSQFMLWYGFTNYGDGVRLRMGDWLRLRLSNSVEFRSLVGLGIEGKWSAFVGMSAIVIKVPNNYNNQHFSNGLVYGLLIDKLIHPFKIIFYKKQSKNSSDNLLFFNYELYKYLLSKRMGRGKGKNILPEQDNLRTQMHEMSESDSPRRSSRTVNSKSPSKKQREKPQPISREEQWSLYRKFFKYSLRRWKFGLLCMILTLMSGVVVSIFPWKLGLVLDVITKQTDNNVDQEQFKQILIDKMVELAIITVSIAVMTFMRTVSLRVYQEKLSIDLRTEIYTNFINNDLNFFEVYKSGQLISRLSNDINQAKSAISNNLTYLIREVMTIVGSIVIMFTMSWKLTFIVLTIVPIYSAVTLQYTRRTKQLVREKQDIEAQISAYLSEKFNAIQTIKSHCSEKQEIEKYLGFNKETYEIQKTRALYQGIHTSCSTFLPSFGSLLVLLYAGMRLYSNNPELSAGQLASFILYCSNLTSTTAGISNSYTNIINGTSAIQKVFKMMGYERLVHEDVGREVQIDGSIEFNRVNFKYPQAQTPIFKDLKFEIKAGEYVAFVGQSGSGKSTITKLIEHFYPIHGGDILFGTENSNQMNIKYLRSQIGLVSQEAAIFSGTLEENITYGLKDYSIAQMEKAAEKAGCLDFINNKSLFPHAYQTIVGERGVNLSGGQRQRVSIARALMRKPKILIFDQATSALDSNSQHLVQQSIEELAKDASITIIVVAHRLSTVINCDRLYVMKQGKIVEIGSHRELIKEKGYYYTLIQKQLHGRADDSESDSQELSIPSPKIRKIKQRKQHASNDKTNDS